MDFIKYSIKDNKVYFEIFINDYINLQPKCDEECILMTLSVIALIERVKSEHGDLRQELLFDCHDSHINKVDNISYLYYIIKEVHKYTKNDILLDKIYVKNYGASLKKFYNKSKYILPDRISNIIEFIEDTEEL